MIVNTKTFQKEKCNKSTQRFSQMNTITFSLFNNYCMSFDLYIFYSFIVFIILTFQTMNPSITNVRNAIDKSLAERDANIDKFCTHLDKDIAELVKEVKEIKQEIQNPTILDPNAEKPKVIGLLERLETRMDELQNRAFQYKNYQKNFKVCVFVSFFFFFVNHMWLFSTIKLRINITTSSTRTTRKNSRYVISREICVGTGLCWLSSWLLTCEVNKRSLVTIKNQLRFTLDVVHNCTPFSI